MSLTTSGMLPMRAATTGVRSAIASISTSGVTSPAGSSSASAAQQPARDVVAVCPAKHTGRSLRACRRRAAA